LDFVWDEVPKFIVDPSIPLVTRVSNLIGIPKKATEGVVVLKEKLLELI
jgi:hypothetical protein